MNLRNFDREVDVLIDRINKTIQSCLAPDRLLLSFIRPMIFVIRAYRNIKNTDTIKERREAINAFDRAKKIVEQTINEVWDDLKKRPGYVEYARTVNRTRGMPSVPEQVSDHPARSVR